MSSELPTHSIILQHERPVIPPVDTNTLTGGGADETIECKISRETPRNISTQRDPSTRKTDTESADTKTRTAEGAFPRSRELKDDATIACRVRSVQRNIICSKTLHPERPESESASTSRLFISIVLVIATAVIPVKSIELVVGTRL